MKFCNALGRQGEIVFRDDGSQAQRATVQRFFEIECSAVDQRHQTPILDDLARTGYYFNRCYSETPVCVAARTSWMTGRHPWLHGSRTNRHVDMDSSKTLPGMLNADGYRTHGVGKMHFSPQRSLHGFESMILCEEGRMAEGDDYHHWLGQTPWAGLERGHGVGNNEINAVASPLPESHYVSSWIATESIAFLERHTECDDRRPFFLWTSFTKPHSPYDLPQPYDRLYSPDGVPPARHSPGDLAEGPPQLHAARDSYLWDTLSADQIAASRAFYYGNVAHVDHCVGRILAALDRFDFRTTTLIVFTADHGDLLGDHNLFFKANFYEGSAHVPLIFWVPETVSRSIGLGGPRQINDLVGASQVMPAIIRFAGLESPAAVVASSPIEIMKGEKPPEAIHGVYDYSPNLQLAVIERRLKYIWWENGRFEQLFDREQDPEELSNLANDSSLAAEKQRMRAWLIDWLKKRGVLRRWTATTWRESTTTFRSPAGVLTTAAYLGDPPTERASPYFEIE